VSAMGETGLAYENIPTLRAPILLTAFAGWGDGALAATSALQYLVDQYKAERLSGLDSDALYDYSTTRPLSRLRENGEREIVWPSLDLYACPLPEAERDLLLLFGPEPDLRWRSCATAILEAAQRADVSSVVALGSYWDRVTHLGAPQLTARAQAVELREALVNLHLPESGYEGPTGFTSALLDACAQAGLAAAGLSARAPHYAQGLGQPRLAAALLETAGRLVGVSLNARELDEAGREQDRELTARLKEEPKLWAYVEQLAAEQSGLGAPDDFTSGAWRSLTSGSASGEAGDSPVQAELPSAEELVDAVEEFFRGAERGQ